MIDNVHLTADKRVRDYTVLLKKRAGLSKKKKKSPPIIHHTLQDSDRSDFMRLPGIIFWLRFLKSVVPWIGNFDKITRPYLPPSKLIVLPDTAQPQPVAYQHVRDTRTTGFGIHLILAGFFEFFFLYAFLFVFGNDWIFSFAGPHDHDDPQRDW